MKNNPLLSFTLLTTPVSQNQFNNWHWSTKREFKEAIQNEVFFTVKRQKLKTPIRIEFKYYISGSRRRDLDNLFPAVKCVIDGLRYAKAIEEDSIEDIPKITLEAVRVKEKPRIEVNIYAL